MKKIFNSEPLTINIEATGFILNVKNWKMPKDNFFLQFNSLNTFSGERETSNSILQRRLKQGSFNPDVRKLRGCRYSGRIQNRGK
jgi:hypothetical protein